MREREIKNSEIEHDTPLIPTDEAMMDLTLTTTCKYKFAPFEWKNEIIW